MHLFFFELHIDFMDFLTMKSTSHQNPYIYLGLNILFDWLLKYLHLNSSNFTMS